MIAAIAAILALLVGGASAYYLKTTHDTAMRNAAIISSAKSSAKAKQREDDQRRTKRAEAVDWIEQTIREYAERNVQEGLVDGPILSVSCDPVGGSTDDLTAQTTIFSCLVANKQNEDGTRTGLIYHATMNWDTDDLTYGYGPPS